MLMADQNMVKACLDEIRRTDPELSEEDVVAGLTYMGDLLSRYGAVVLAEVIECLEAEERNFVRTL
jgi:hypothetical protein